jgi:hypothetical protein
MDKPRVEKILEKCTPDEKIRVTTLYNGSLRALKAYQEQPTAANLKDWEAAEAALVRLVEEIEGRVYPSEPPLKNKLAAVACLQESGWKIKKTNLYTRFQEMAVKKFSFPLENTKKDFLLIGIQTNGKNFIL